MQNKSTGIADSIYGRVEFDPTEKAVIDSALFQRLRKIRQLGLCELVFPGAVHSRFSHSIGVMHVAGKYFDAVFRKFPRSRPETVETLCLLRRIVRLSALLHDVGHGPFSHLFEHMLVHLEIKENRLIKCTAEYLRDSDFGIPTEWIKSDKLNAYLEKPLEHEHYSLAAIRNLFKNQPYDHSLAADIAQSICCLMDEDVKLSETLERILNHLRTEFLQSRGSDDSSKGAADKKKEVESLRKCLKSIISGEVDADRIDYLARDAQHCGIPLAAGDIDYLLDTLSLEYEPERPKSELEFARNQFPARNFYLLMAKSGVRPFEQLLMVRKQLFDIVYSHRINDSFGRLLQLVVTDVLKKRYSARSEEVARVTDLTGAPRTLGDFLRMTDSWLERQVEAVARSADNLFSEEAVTAARLIVTRTPLVRIPEKEAEVLLEELEDSENQINQEHKNDCFIVTRPLKELTKLARDNIRYDSEILRIKVRGDASKPINVSAVSDLLKSTLFTKSKVRLFVFASITESAKEQKLPERFREWLGQSPVSETTFVPCPVKPTVPAEPQPTA